MQKLHWVGALSLVLSFVGNAAGSIVGLQNATATFSQGNFNVSEAINGDYSGTTFEGWAIHNPAISGPDKTASQTAVFETVAPTPSASASLLTFQLHQLFVGPNRINPNPFHVLGSFRLSATTDAPGTFGTGSGNWVELTPFFLDSTGAADTLSVLPGTNIVLAGGVTPLTAVYTIQATTTLSGITGFRLEALEQPSLPGSGPGRQPSNGNFVLTEFTVDIQAVPEASSVAIWAVIGLVSSGWLIKRKAAAA